MQQLGYQRPILGLEWTGAMMLHVASEGHVDEFGGYFPYSGDFPTPAAFQAMYAALDQPQNVVYRGWFEAEQATEFAKLFANLLAQGVVRLVHVQYADFRPGAPWDNVWWNWQGVVKYVGGTPIRKPSYYTYDLLASRLSGFTSARRVGPGGNVRLYEFTLATGDSGLRPVDGRAEAAVLDLDPVVPRNNVRVTHVVTELDAAGQPIVLPSRPCPRPRSRRGRCRSSSGPSISAEPIWQLQSPPPTWGGIGWGVEKDRARDRQRAVVTRRSEHVLVAAGRSRPPPRLLPAGARPPRPAGRRPGHGELPRVQ